MESLENKTITTILTSKTDDKLVLFMNDMYQNNKRLAIRMYYCDNIKLRQTFGIMENGSNNNNNYFTGNSMSTILNKTTMVAEICNMIKQFLYYHVMYYSKPLPKHFSMKFTHDSRKDDHYANIDYEISLDYGSHTFCFTKNFIGCKTRGGKWCFDLLINEDMSKIYPFEDMSKFDLIFDITDKIWTKICELYELN